MKVLHLLILLFRSDILIWKHHRFKHSFMATYHLGHLEKEKKKCLTKCHTRFQISSVSCLSAHVHSCLTRQSCMYILYFLVIFAISSIFKYSYSHIFYYIYSYIFSFCILYLCYSRSTSASRLRFFPNLLFK